MGTKMCSTFGWMFYTVVHRVLSPRDDEERVLVAKVCECRDSVDEALPYLALSKFNALRSLIENSLLCPPKAEELGNW